MEKTTKMDDSVFLPLELMIMILLRLPVKSLIRFKCVCKSWLSLISDPQFAKSQFELAASSRERLLMFSSAALQIVSVDYNTPSLHDDSASSIVKLNFPLQQLTPQLKSPYFPPAILGCCRGFTLFRSHPNLYVWNPCTGFHKEIPYPPSHSKPNYPIVPLIQGLGYDASTDDYLVFLAFEYQIGYITEIFSLRANMWEQLNDTRLQSVYDLYDFKFDGDMGLFFSGNIHWIAFEPTILDGHSIAQIIAFDLKERDFFEIDLPCIHRDISSDVYVFGGYLGICQYDDFGFNIWVMKEYRVDSSWSTIHVVIHDIRTATGYVSPICLTKSQDIVATDGYKELVRFNGEVIERRQNYYHPEECPHCGLLKEECFDIQEWTVVQHTESLLSLPCDS